MAKDLSPNQKLLIALVSNLSSERGYCFASNNYLGECLQVAPETISRNISELVDKGYLGRIIKLDDKKHVEMRILTVVERQPLPSETSIPPGLNVNTPPLGNVKENNKVFNNKENSKYKYLEIPENKINSAIEYIVHTKHVNADRDLILVLWTNFKEKNFTGPENDFHYPTENKVYSHFLQSLKYEQINGNTTHLRPITGSNGKLGTSAARVEALKKW